MSHRTATAKILADYFNEKGHIFTPSEYMKAKDVPIRFATIKKNFGSWNRMENIVRGLDPKFARDREPDTDVAEVIRRNAAAEREYAEKMKAASENLEAKTAREEAARKQMEEDKLRAATAAGAAENKMRKGGITSQDAKAQREAIEQAVAEEHALLAQTGAGSAVGKHLLGGVEDNDEKTRAIALQNEMRTRTKLMAATPEGAAEAKLMEDDTDGQLTREAQARIRAELRPYVPPATDGATKQALEEGQSKVRDEVRKIVEEAKGDENVLTDSVFRATLARQRHAQSLNDPIATAEIPEDIMKTMPPAQQLPAAGFVDDEGNLKDAKGNTVGHFDKPEEDEKTEADVDDEANEDEVRTESAKKAAKLSSGEKAANKDNPKATPADRNPDPKVAPLADPHAGDKKQGNEGAAKPVGDKKPAAKK